MESGKNWHKTQEIDGDTVYTIAITNKIILPIVMITKNPIPNPALIYVCSLNKKAH